jgi:hypothetical protein
MGRAGKASRRLASCYRLGVASGDRSVDDHGRPILEPAVYEPVFDAAGKRIGWLLPDHERPRWDKSEQLLETWQADVSKAHLHLEAGLNCEQCGKVLTASQKRFCSRACSTKAHFRSSPD